VRSSLKLKIGSSSSHTRKSSYRYKFVIVKLGEGGVEGLKKVNGGMNVKIDREVVKSGVRVKVDYVLILGFLMQVSK
jgi:uncharacterized FAD-dependent dehydrogenase